MISCDVVAASVETVGVLVSVSVLVPVARSIDAVSIDVALTMVSVMLSGDAVGTFVVTVLTSIAAEVIPEVRVAGLVTLVKVVPVVVITVVDIDPTMPVVVVNIVPANVELAFSVMCVDAEDVPKTIHGL